MKGSEIKKNMDQTIEHSFLYIFLEWLRVPIGGCSLSMLEFFYVRFYIGRGCCFFVSSHSFLAFWCFHIAHT